MPRRGVWSAQYANPANSFAPITDATRLLSFFLHYHTVPGRKSHRSSAHQDLKRAGMVNGNHRDAYGSGGPILTRKNCAGKAAAFVSVHWKKVAGGELVMKSVLQFIKFDEPCTA
jgi:hypothetical protein